MYRTHAIDTYQQRSRWQWVAYVGVVVGLLYLLLLTGPTALAASVPGGNIADPAVRTANIASPAIVRIITEVKGRLTVQFPPTTQITFPQQENGTYAVSFSGTGVFISSQGDILTADHVVNPPEGKELDQALYPAAAEEIAAYINKNAKPGDPSVTAEQVIQQLTDGTLKSTAAYEEPTRTAYLTTGYTGPLEASDRPGIPKELVLPIDEVKKSSPTDQRDMAIVHVAMQDTPSVPIGNSKDVQLQDELTVIGFPGNADVSSRPNDLLTPSRNTVSVSATSKQSENGSPLLQVSGNLGHGDSGAPALNSAGEIVGIVSFRQSDSDNASSAATFLQASESAQMMVQDLQLDTAPGQFQQLWQQTYQEYAATTPGHWSKAQSGFDQLAEKYPLFKAVKPYQEYTSEQATKEAEPTPTATQTVQATPTTQANQTTPVPVGGNNSESTPFSLPIALLAGGAVLVVILLAGTLFVVSLRPGKSKKKPVAVVAKPVVEEKEEEVEVEEKVSDKNKGAVTPAVSSSAPAPTLPEPMPMPTPATTQGSMPTPTPTSVPAAKPVVTPVPTTAVTQKNQPTLALKIWPCGHMNRPTARFCSVCGDAAPG